MATHTATTADPCPCCGPIATVSCTSQTSTPTLCGYSAYVNPNDGPVYKWQVRTLGGEWSTLSNFCSANECGSGTSAFGQKFTFSGDVTINCEGKSVSTSSDGYAYDSSCSEVFQNHYDFLESINLGSDPACVSGISHAETLTQTTRTLTACGCIIDRAGKAFGTATETLSSPDTIEAAIARATPVEGTSCCAVTGIIDSTDAKSEDPISAGESTSVSMAVDVTGGAPSTDYTLTITFKNYVDSTDVEEAETTMDVDITTDALGEWSDDIAIPQPAADRRRCYDRYELTPV